MAEEQPKTPIAKILLALVVLEILGAGIYFLSLRGKAAYAPSLSIEPLEAPKATLSLKSEKNNLKVGEKIEVEALLSLSEGMKLSAVDLDISYNPKLLKVIDSDTQKSETQIETKEAKFNWPRNSVSLEGERGSIKLTGYTEKETAFPEEVTLASIKFEAISPGTAEIKWTFSEGITEESNVLLRSSGNDILKEVANITLNIVE